jgi:hypothetical protein
MQKTMLPKFFVLAFFLPLIAAQCGRTPRPDHCDNIDFGTCGNACCRLVALVDTDVGTTKAMLEKLLLSGGPEDLYTLESPVCNPVEPDCYNSTAQFVDYSPYNLTDDLGLVSFWGHDRACASCGVLNFTVCVFFFAHGQVYYMGKATHKAPILHFIDWMFISMGPNAFSFISWAKTQIKIFSISGPGGSFGDNGQNYYQIVTLLEATGFGQLEWFRLDSSCPGPDSSTWPPTQNALPQQRTEQAMHNALQPSL